MGGVERNVVILVCAISAGIHGALAPEHFGEDAGAGLGFLVSALVLAGLALAVTRDPGPSALVATILTLAGLIAAYALAVTSGVPVLHPKIEPVDGLGLATKAIEIAGLVAATHLFLRDRPVALHTTERTLT